MEHFNKFYKKFKFFTLCICMLSCIQLNAQNCGTVTSFDWDTDANGDYTFTVCVVSTSNGNKSVEWEIFKAGIKLAESEEFSSDPLGCILTPPQNQGADCYVHALVTNPGGISDPYLIWNGWTSTNGLCQGTVCQSGAIGDIITLAVSDLQLQATLDDKEVHLEWTTQSEIDNYGFEVQRNDGSAWTTIGFVSGRGNSTEMTRYAFVDTDYIPQSVYRLNQIDQNGVANLSEIVSISRLNKGIKNINVFPNPANSKLYFSNLEGNEKIYLIGIDGTKIDQFFLQSGDNFLDQDISQVPQGIYILKIISGDKIESKQLLINR